LYQVFELVFLALACTHLEVAAPEIAKELWHASPEKIGKVAFVDAVARYRPCEQHHELVLSMLRILDGQEVELVGGMIVGVQAVRYAAAGLSSVVVE
jgi:hypothetical protein